MIVGAALRFVHLDGKIFSNDETTTSVHVSGKTIDGFSQAVFDGRTRTAADLLAYQKPDPAHGPSDVVSSLAVEDPQHPPLYYLAERQWELGAGSSIAARRALPAIFGVLAIAAAVWLGIELWSPLAGAMSGALVAASPFAIAYAQFAREYSLWLLLTFASTALLVRATREGRLVWWIAYALCSIAGVYTDTLYALVIVAHVIALPFFAGRRLRGAAIAFAVAIGVTLCLYAPWIQALRTGYAHGLVTNNAYLAAGLPLKLFALKWIFNMGALFFDADYRFPKTAVLILPGLVALALASVACVRAARTNRTLVVLFALAVFATLALVVPDLLHHQQRSTSSRYLVPLWVAAYAALGVWLAMLANASSVRARVWAAGFLAFAAVAGFASFAVSTRYDTWWVDGSTAGIGPIARAIAAAHDPSVVWQATWGPGAVEPQAWDFSVLILANHVPASTRFTVFRGNQPLAFPVTAGATLLLDPGNALIARLRARGDRPVEADTAVATDSQVALLRAAAEKERRVRDASSTRLSLWSLSPVR